MINNLILTLFIGLLASCQTPIVKPVYQYSHQFDLCIVKCFDYSRFESVDDSLCGEKFQSGEFNSILCDGVIGPFIDDYALDIKPSAIREIAKCEAK